MSPSTKKKRNPFMNNDLNSLCVACNGKLRNAETVSIQEMLPHVNTTLFEGLKLVSNFGELNIDYVPQRACNTCFLNMDAFLRFQYLCNRSVDNINSYIMHQKEIKCNTKPECAATPCDDIFVEECPNGIEEPLEIEIVTANVSDHDVQSDVKEDTSSHIIQETGKRGPKSRRSKLLAKDRIECKICHKFYRRDYMKYHSNVHSGDRPHSCKICEESFFCPARLWVHMKFSHSNEYPHLCSICGSAYKISQDLKKHVRIKHTNERPYVCETCGKAFKTSTQRKNHYTTHSDEKMFQCEKCPKRFPTRQALVQHSVTHAEIRPFECEFCGKRFTQRHCLRSHQVKTCEAIHQSETSTYRK